MRYVGAGERPDVFSIRDRQAWERKLNGMRMGHKLRQYALIIDDI
jgi:hypothetical protein